MITALDHVAIAVPDLNIAIHTWRGLLGREPGPLERSASEQVEETVFPIGGSYLQLISPLAPSSSVSQYLARRGQGLHHIALRVEDLDRSIESVQALRARIIEPRLRFGGRGTRICFLHPLSFTGVLVELVETPKSETAGNSAR